MIVKDAMVLIHLAKITLLEKSCNYFRKIFISTKIYEEILMGKEKDCPDVEIIVDLVAKKKIRIGKIKQQDLLKKANDFNILHPPIIKFPPTFR